MAIQNINENFGDPIVFDTIEEMGEAIRACGYELPEDGLREGRDFETFGAEKADIEAPYFDKNGKQIKEFAVLKVYHFSGLNEQGRGRKHYYMYKWVRLKEHKGKKYWIARHLSEDKESSYYNLRAVADKSSIKGRC